MANAIARRAALALFLVAPLLAQSRRLLPVDQSARDPKLVAYLEKFKQGVAHRNRDELIPLVAPEIKLGFDAEGGIANFQPDWPALERLLSLGGAWQGDAFCLPYVFARFPDDLDAFDYAAITGQGVWLRERPAAGARGLKQLSYDIVKVQNQDESWWEIETMDGTRGYVSARYVVSPIGLRAIFQKNRRGEWKLSALLAGD